MHNKIMSFPAQYLKTPIMCTCAPQPHIMELTHKDVCLFSVPSCTSPFGNHIDICSYWRVAVDEQPLSTTCKSCKQLNASEPEWGSQITMNIKQSWLL